MPDGYTREQNYSANPRQGFGAEPVADAQMNGVLAVEIGDDGSVTLAAPAVHRGKDTAPPSTFGDNLALNTDGDLPGLAQDILDGIQADEGSRKLFIENYTEGLKLLGLTIEDMDRNEGPASRIGHPMLLGAVVKAQSAASAELLPSGGPCKVKTHEGDDAQQDELAQALERDMNYYLTTVATEYYPDMDRGLFGLMFGGNLFKKVYEHPLRRRPVSEAIDMMDLIVSEDATDLDTATRITHRAEMARAQVRRMQKFGHWRDVALSMPQPSQSADQRAKDDVSGVRPFGLRPQDIPFCIYETTCDQVLADYNIRDPHADSDLPVSYAVTLERDTRQVLDIRRRWKFGDEEYERKQQFVHYGMIPALGFLCLGHLHLLGNQTKALRAIWRILVTAGMYANAPAGVKLKGTRMSTNEIKPMPGEWPDIDAAGVDDIRKAMMALPYKDASPTFIQFADMIAKESGQLSSAADAPMGEGRVDIPVGTILAMIEQATHIESSVHKRLYRSQARELQLLKECFAENPEALWRLNKSPARQWQAAAEFTDIDLVPASDPNVPSQMHRIMLATAMVTVAGQNQDIYDRVAVHDRAWKSIGVNDADQFLHQPAPQPAPGGAAPPDPLIGQARMIEAQAKVAKAQNDSVDQQRKAANEALTAQHQGTALQAEAAAKAAELASEERIQNERLAVEHERLNVEQVRAAAEHERATQEMQHQHEQTMTGHRIAAAGHGLDVAATAAEHERGLKELEIKRKVANKPAPRPAAKGKK